MLKITRQPGAVIVTRVSTGEQVKEGTSLGTQLTVCLAKAASLNLPVIATYEDAGVSGAFLTSRTGMTSAIADIQTGRATTLICATMSRYSRDGEHQKAILKSVRQAGGQVVFCDMDFADTPEGDMMFTFMGGYAEYERAVIQKRTYEGHVARAQAGVQTARATSPFGYVIPKRDDIIRGTFPASDLGKYLIVPEQTEVVKQMFARYDAGTDSLNDLSKWLNRSGVPTPGGAAIWRASTVRFILKNPVYKGVASFGREDHSTDENRLTMIDTRTGLPRISTKGATPADPDTIITWPIEAIVSEEQWERVQQRLEEGKKFKGGSPAYVRMLAGRLACPVCGGGMNCSAPTKTKSKKDPNVIFTYPHRYQCGHYRRTLLDAGEPGCIPTGYYAHEVEAAVVRAVVKAEEEPHWIEHALATYAKPIPAEATGVDTAHELSRIEKGLKQLEAKQTATVQAQIAGIMAGAPGNAYNSVFAAIAEERADLEERRTALGKAGKARQGGAAQTEPVDMAKIMRETRRVLESEFLTGAEKREAIGAVIEKVTPIKQADGHSGAEVTFLPGLFVSTSLQPPRDVCQPQQASSFPWFHLLIA